MHLHVMRIGSAFKSGIVPKVILFGNGINIFDSPFAPIIDRRETHAVVLRRYQRVRVQKCPISALVSRLFCMLRGGGETPFNLTSGAPF